MSKQINVYNSYKASSLVLHRQLYIVQPEAFILSRTVSFFQPYILVRPFCFSQMLLMLMTLMKLTIAHSVLVRVSTATAKHPDQKASWGGTDLFSLHFLIAAHCQRKSGQELK